MTAVAVTNAIPGSESTVRHRRSDAADESVAPGTLQNRSESRHSRQSHRSTSYHNVFQTSCTAANDKPPQYAYACHHHRPSRQHIHPSRDILPAYSSTANAAAKLLVYVESLNPLQGVVESEWREVFVVVRGTMLCLHRVKDGGQGKLLRTYTLQHAEVGLAPDAEHTLLIPLSRLAMLLPASARKKALQRDPFLFREVPQTILRLRAESDQILLAGSSEETVHQFVHTISAAIDISPAIDERGLPRQCTVPRRRRRARNSSNDINDPNLLAQQARIFREMYPAFAGNRPEDGNDLHRQETTEMPLERLESSSSREDDELDLAIMREEAAARPRASAPPAPRDPTLRPLNPRQTTIESINSTFSEDMMYSTAQENFNSEGKWQPPNNRSYSQVQRYAKRCMPILLADAPRASDIIICNGKRVRINWRMELLEEWELKPPSYKSHGFEDSAKINSGASLQRSTSTSSAHASGTDATQPSSSSLSGNDTDAISPTEQSFGNVKLAKDNSTNESTRRSRRHNNNNANTTDGTKVRNQINTDMHGVVFYF